MKKLYYLLLFISCGVMAQIPQGFSYQAVALNTSGNPVASSPVKIRLSILENSATGSASYVELHNPTTNNVGLFTLTIGQGTAQTGTFAGINWAENSKFLKVEIDVNNGSNYITVGSSQLLSVPYAMYAGAVAGFGNSGNGTQLMQLFLYGTFNSYNAGTALPLMYENDNFLCYKYLTAGTQFKFIPALNATTAYGNGGGNNLAPNATAFTVTSNGIYFIRVELTSSGSNGNGYTSYITSIAPRVNTTYGTNIPMTYNAGNNTLSCTVTVPSFLNPPDRKFFFTLQDDNNIYGDNLADGTINKNGTEIYFPATGTNFLVTLNLNFTGEGSPYTITPQ